ncbi:MAG: fumarylacetoacetate hydrolase family protein, partial [Clostridia bacterium]|nr:fumarylacetoacetate hydrolase family protein [Clostridia bacterium]
NMIWNVYEMVAAVSRFTTLLPGDVVSTGTPSGIGEAFDGDVVEITVEGVGTLKNTYRLKE